MRGADKEAQGTATPPEREPRVSRADGGNDGAQMPTALAGTLSGRHLYMMLHEIASALRAWGGGSLSSLWVGRLWFGWLSGWVVACG